MRVLYVKLSGWMLLSCISVRRDHAWFILLDLTQASIRELYVTSFGFNPHSFIRSNISQAKLNLFSYAHPLIIVLNEISSGLILGLGISALIYLKREIALSTYLQLMQASSSTLNRISSGLKLPFSLRLTNKSNAFCKS